MGGLSDKSVGRSEKSVDNEGEKLGDFDFENILFEILMRVGFFLIFKIPYKISRMHILYK